MLKYLKAKGLRSSRENNRYDLVRPKTITHCVAFNQEHFIEAWVRNAATYSDEMIVLFSKYPWNYNKNAKRMITADKTGEILTRLKEEFPQLTVIESKWANETDQRNDAIKIARKQGGELLLIVDTDEYFEVDEILAAYNWMQEHPAHVWYMHHVQLIKKINWSVVTPEGNPRFEFAIDLRQVKSFKDKRIPKAEKKMTIPENICKCWHFSYLMPEKKIQEKLLSFGHAQEIRSNWLTEVWPQIGLHTIDIHPVTPTGLKEI
ncbi:glycosyltransferase [bacterium]|nr:glycosyltransferase [bacterium]